MENLCKLCFGISESLNITPLSDESKEICNKIYLCFQIIIDPEKYVAFIICNECTDKLNNAFKFRQMCLTIDERYKEILMEINKKSVEIDEGVNNEFHFENLQSRNIENVYEESDFDATPIQSTDIDHIHEKPKNIARGYNEMSFKCNICTKVLKSMSSLLKHIVSMHEKRKQVGKVSGHGAMRRYHCITCSYSSPYSQTLEKHMRTHDGARPYHCECGKRFTQSSSLATHRKTHSNTTYFTCTICGKQFKHGFTLKQHLSVHEVGKFCCNVCNKVMKSKQSLANHMHRHNNIFNFNCEDCGDMFVTSGELSTHRKTHMRLKHLECHICGYKTNTKKSLILHLKRHSGNKNYKCEYCEAAFYMIGDLRRHRRVHTREKPYPCPRCAQRFMYSPSLNRHMQNLHGVQYKWCDYKEKETRKNKH